MSQIRNKVKWCLSKAKREIEEGKNHRGLVEIGSDMTEAKNHIKKAEHNFKALLSNEKNGFSDWAVSAGFYTIYHCFLAIISKFGYESRNQECTIALVESLYEDKKIGLSPDIIDAIKTSDHEKRQEISAIELRENFQYGSETEVEDKYIDELKSICKKSIAEAKQIIYKKKD
jgi:uncharacterized protein (UPF0332 family)